MGLRDIPTQGAELLVPALEHACEVHFDFSARLARYSLGSEYEAQGEADDLVDGFHVAWTWRRDLVVR